LTDDYAPVENMLAPVVRQSAREILARKYLQQAQEFQRQGAWDKSISKYEQAVQLNPSMSIKAFNEIGMMLVAKGSLKEAVEAFRKAVDYHQQADTGETAIASVHLNLGVLLRRVGQPQEGEEHLKKAIEWFRIEAEENPNLVVTWSRLGNTLATMGNLQAASEAFRKALELEPNNPTHYDTLAKALEYQGKYDEAISVLQKQIQLMKRYNQEETAAKLAEYIEFLEYKKSR